MITGPGSWLLRAVALVWLLGCAPEVAQTNAPTSGAPTPTAPDTGDPGTSSPTTSGPTTWNPDTGDPDTGDPGTGDPTTGPPTTLEPPDWCEAAVADGLQLIGTTEAAPYFVHHPDTAALDVPTVIFLPGGSGSQGVAEVAWTSWLSGGTGLGQVRAVLPFATDGSLLDEVDRTLDVLDEILQCYGGDPGRVHLAGTSNGGRGAFDLMLREPSAFATLLGAPGVFSSYPSFDDDAIHAALDEKAVFNGVGAEDSGWVAAVQATHAHLAAEGIDSVLVEFEGEGHLLSEEFDETVFFDFWLAH